MKDMKRQEFDRGWKAAFGDAEISPSDTLWTNIELELEKAAGEKMKRRIVFYKFMAAASVSFAMLMAGIGAYYYNSHISANQLAVKTTQKSQHTEIQNSNVENEGREHVIEETTKNFTAKDNLPRFNNQAIEATQNNLSAYESQLRNVNNTRAGSDKIVNGNNTISSNNSSEGNLLTPDITKPGNSNTESLMLTDSKLPSLAYTKKIKLSLPAAEPDPLMVMMAKLEKREQELMQNKNHKNKISKNKDEVKKTERLWTSLGLATGTYTATNVNVNSSPSTANALASSDKVPSSQSKTPGTAYSIGLNLGAKITDRWILQGGVNYLSQNSTYEANAVLSNTSSNKNFRVPAPQLNHESSDIINTKPFNVNNNLQFVNVPLQAGYMAVNRRFGIQLNAGISTDLFLKSTESAQNSSNIDDVTHVSGDNSLYRNINFSGLMGTEVSYRFGKRYRLALNPGFRYPFNSIYKSSVNIDATPLTFDVGMRFRYIFY